MNNKPNRVARLTSSNAGLLVVSGNGKYGFGAGAITYFKKKVMELEYCRGVELPVNKWEMLWGKVWEVWVHWQLGNDYELCLDQTVIHPKHSFWSGSKDFGFIPKPKAKGVSELKAYQLVNHYDYTKCLQQKSIELFKKQFKDEYWQIISNAILDAADYGEAIAFMPTLENLLEMRKLITNSDYLTKNMKETDPGKYMFMVTRDVLDLPFIPDGSTVPSMTKFRFEIPMADKVFLTERFMKGDLYVNDILQGTL